jgi:hypothetical protein
MVNMSTTVCTLKMLAAPLHLATIVNIQISIIQFSLFIQGRVMPNERIPWWRHVNCARLGNRVLSTSDDRLLRNLDGRDFSCLVLLCGSTTSDPAAKGRSASALSLISGAATHTDQFPIRFFVGGGDSWVSSRIYV